ncbi:MAG: C39 family peptidase [Clostridia bacterium]|nr:C39 family peptidase [Clostridia bacterium]
MKPTYYSQYDEPYASYPYPSANHPQANIKSSGCGVTCFAMVQATLQNPKYTPIDGAKDAISMNDRGLEGTEDEFFQHAAAKYKLQFSQTSDLNTVLDSLKNGKLVVCRMKDWFRPGAGHFILSWGVNNGKIQINDPASRENSQKLWDTTIFTQKCIRYFIYGKL